MLEVERGVGPALLFLELVHEPLVLADPEINEVRHIGVDSFREKVGADSQVLVLRRAHAQLLAN